MNQIEFSVLSYYPSIVTQENINVAILFHIKDVDSIYFHTLKKWRRLESFDDELDINFMKQYLAGVKSQLELGDLFGPKTSFNMERYIKFYVNELRFSPIQFVQTEDVDGFIDSACRLNMKFDYALEERLNRDNEIKYIKTLLKSNNVPFSSTPVRGKHDDKIQYDYIVKDYGFKNFSFDNKNAARMIPAAKAWAYNADALKKTYKTIFVYDIDQSDSHEFNTAIGILKECAYEVLKTSEVTPFIIDQLKRG